MARTKISLQQDLITVAIWELGFRLIGWGAGLVAVAGLRWLLTSGEDD